MEEKNKVPKILYEQREKILYKLELTSNRIEHHTNAWVENQKKLIEINDAIDSLRGDCDEKNN